MAPSTNVPGAIVPLATNVEEKGQFYRTEELEFIVAEGVKKALAEREAAKDDAGRSTFGVTSAESSKGAEEFREGFQKFMEGQEKTSKTWEVQARGLAGAAAKMAELEEELRSAFEKDRANREEERLVQREEERTRLAAAEHASRAFVDAGQARLVALHQQLKEELVQLREARALAGPRRPHPSLLHL